MKKGVKTIKDLYKLSHFISDLHDFEYIEYCKEDEEYKYLLKCLDDYYFKLKEELKEKEVN